MAIIRMKNRRQETGDKKIRQMHLLRYCLISLSPFFLITFLLFSSCAPDCNTPFGEGAVIDTYQPEFASLSNVGGTVIINRGYKGIFVRRVSYSEFVAFECACPHCREVRLLPLDGWEGEVLECPDCKSRYETLYGQPLEGAASGCPLYEYRTHYDGILLEIY